MTPPEQQRIKVQGTSPSRKRSFRDGDTTASGWHLELVPRLTALAGIELGAGIYVVTVPPDEAAEELGKAKDRL